MARISESRGSAKIRSDRGSRTQHDKPLGLLDTVVVGLGVTERGNGDLVGLVDLGLGAVADEDGLASPLDDNLRSGLSVAIPAGRTAEPSTRLLTFLPSGMAFRSTSTLAMAKTSAEADMLTRNSAIETTRQPMLAQNTFPSIISSSRSSIRLSGDSWGKKAVVPWTVDFAPAAVMAPMVPTMKYEMRWLP